MIGLLDSLVGEAKKSVTMLHPHADGTAVEHG